jgi:two-component sensor histidine kinase
VELAMHPRQHSIPSVLPDCLRLVGSQGLPAEAAQTLAVALTEALGNAVDHGLLRLDTRLKEEGFMAYDAARQAGLEAAPAHAIHLRIALHSDAQNRIREVAVDVEDPGPGFDWRAWQNRSAHGQRGRGLRILQSIALDLGFNEAGNAIHFTLPCG